MAPKRKPRNKKDDSCSDDENNHATAPSKVSKSPQSSAKSQRKAPTKRSAHPDSESSEEDVGDIRGAARKGFKGFAFASSSSSSEPSSSESSESSSESEEESVSHVKENSDDRAPVQVDGGQTLKSPQTKVCSAMGCCSG